MKTSKIFPGLILGLALISASTAFVYRVSIDTAPITEHTSESTIFIGISLIGLAGFIGRKKA